MYAPEFQLLSACCCGSFFARASAFRPVEYVSCAPTESARELFDEDCEPVEEEQ